MRPETIKKLEKTNDLMVKGMAQPAACRQVGWSKSAYYYAAKKAKSEKGAAVQQVTVNLKPTYSQELATVESLLEAAMGLLRNVKGQANAN